MSQQIPFPVKSQPLSKGILCLLCLLLFLGGSFLQGCLVGKPCESDTDCSQELPKCIDKSCQACRTTEDCQEGQTCVAYRCVQQGESGQQNEPTQVQKEPSSPREKAKEPITKEATPEKSPEPSVELSPEPVPDASEELTPPEKASESTPESASEQAQEKTNPPEVICVQGEQRPCYKGPAGTAGKGICKRGIQFCANGKWSWNCQKQVLPGKEICDGKDNNCDGKVDESCPCKQGDTQPCGSNKGLCKQGKQTCSAGKWSICKGAIGPGPELCDKLDNDCDGQVDENFALTATCYVGKGECRKKGVRVCTSDKKGATCKGTPGKAVTEVCDGKDNDCDGQVDENFKALLGKPCSQGLGICKRTGKYICKLLKAACSVTSGPKAPEICDGKDNDCDGKVDDGNPGGGKGCSVAGKLGECKKGVMTCTSGKIVCVSSHKTTTEKCRNGKDDDCDGLIDEICGPLHSYIRVSSSGKLESARNFSSPSRTRTGYYLIKTTSKSYCLKRPFFVSPRSTGNVMSEYHCVLNNVMVRTSSKSAFNRYAYASMPFNLVSPVGSKEIWGTYSGGTCSRFAYCNLLNSQGSPRIRNISTGRYYIYHAACKPNVPLMLSLYNAKTIPGYIWGRGISTGICEVRTYNHSGSAVNMGFSFWIVDRGSNVWAQVLSTGKLGINNHFKDQKARWSHSYTSSIHTLNFPGWSKPGTAILTAEGQGTAIFYENTTTGIKARTRAFPLGTYRSIQFYTLFVQ